MSGLSLGGVANVTGDDAGFSGPDDYEIGKDGINRSGKWAQNTNLYGAGGSDPWDSDEFRDTLAPWQQRWLDSDKVLDHQRQQLFAATQGQLSEDDVSRLNIVGFNRQVKSGAIANGMARDGTQKGVTQESWQEQADRVGRVTDPNTRKSTFNVLTTDAGNVPAEITPPTLTTGGQPNKMSLLDQAILSAVVGDGKAPQINAPQTVAENGGESNMQQFLGVAALIAGFLVI